jgi:hypothetical protein
MVPVRQGLKWVLKMYLEGDCSDYRFTYDAHSPSASQLVDALRCANDGPEAAASSAAGRVRAGALL